MLKLGEDSSFCFQFYSFVPIWNKGNIFSKIVKKIISIKLQNYKQKYQKYVGEGGGGAKFFTHDTFKIIFFNLCEFCTFFLEFCS